LLTFPSQIKCVIIPYNSGDSFRRYKDYLFINLELENSNLIIKDNLQLDANEECKKCGVYYGGTCARSECQGIADRINSPCYYISKPDYDPTGGTCHENPNEFYEYKLEPNAQIQPDAQPSQGEPIFPSL